MTALPGSMPTTGRWGWYKDHEGREARRVSTLVKKVETDTYHLDRWNERQVAEGLAIRDDLVTAIKAMGRPVAEDGWTRADKNKLNTIVKDAQAAAKQRDGGKLGTAMHDLTERVDRGEPIEDVVRGLPAAPAQSLRAYEALRRLNGWRNVEIERTVECEELEVRGSFDRVDLVPGLAALLGPGTCQYESGGILTDHVHYGPFYESGHSDELPVVVDVKTEAEPWRNGLHIAPQLAIYSRAKKMWRPTGGEHVLLDYKGNPVMSAQGYEVMVPNGEYVPAPCVRQDVAIVAHVLDGDAVPYFVNLAEGWQAAVAAYEQMNRESRSKRALGAAGAWFVPVPNIQRPRPAELLVQQAVAADYANPARPTAGEASLALPPVPPGGYAVGGKVTVGGIEFTKHAEPLSGAELVGGHGPMPGAADGKDELRRHLIEAIWRAVTLDGLAILWNMARDREVPWVGPVAQAADARRRQIECPQRELHKGGGKCACGWMPPVPA